MIINRKSQVSPGFHQIILLVRLDIGRLTARHRDNNGRLAMQSVELNIFEIERNTTLSTFLGEGGNRVLMSFVYSRHQVATYASGQVPAHL